MLGRPIEHNRSPETDKAKERTPWLGFDLTFLKPLVDGTHRVGARG
ncbi:hypothetical protein STENM223S_00206 [Streptomyces tendae]